MPGDDLITVVGDHRIDEAETFDRVGNLADLLLAMLVSIAPGRPELTDDTISIGLCRSSGVAVFVPLVQVS
jgi:hypothetical protein